MVKRHRVKIPKLISLITDYGTEDESVGVLKGVIKNICPDSYILDITHDIGDYSIREGAWALWAATQHIPIGNHVVVVDPGVGTDRKAIVIETETEDKLFGPDNGILIPAAKNLGIKTVVESMDPYLMWGEPSGIFHGRDIFAPNAAFSAKNDYNGVSVFGTEMHPNELVKEPYDLVAKRGSLDEITSEVIKVDHFGNIFTNVETEELSKDIGYGENASVHGLGISPYSRSIPFHRTFGDVGEGDLVLTDNAYGQIQIAENMGNAAERLGVKSGDKLVFGTY